MLDGEGAAAPHGRARVVGELRAPEDERVRRRVHVGEVAVGRALQDEVAAVVGRVVVAAVGVVGDAKKLFPDDLNASGPWMICAKRVTIAPAHMSGGVTRDVRGPDT